MLGYLFAFLLLFHGWIHLLGFVKAFKLATVSQLKMEISKPFGVLWFIIGMLFVYLALSFLVHEDWYFFGFVAVALSQCLIFIFWQDAKAASIVNLLVFSVALVQYAGDRFEHQYERDVIANLKKGAMDEELITKEDLEHLPLPVANYLEYVGVIGKPKVKNMKVTFVGKMRKKGGGWFSFASAQHNVFGDSPARLFFMKAKLTGLPAYGYHSYQKGDARMLIKMMSLFPVVDLEGKQLFKAETVTLFNDLCLLAPSALIDKNIEWEAVNDTTAKVKFTNQGVSISASLHFNKVHQLTNFVSDDRYEMSGKEVVQYRFSTPVGKFRKFNGLNLPSYGEAIWHYPEGEYIYGKFNVQEIHYNLTLDSLAF
ncbi:MAG: DUF6544 family protein [Ekhidna sp.]